MFPTDKVWKKKLKCFNQWRNVPDDFLGECYIEDIDQIFWLNPNKVYHRINGPAVIYKSGEQWWEHGKLHRLDGPALIIVNTKRYFVRDRLFEEDEFWSHPLVLKHKLEKILQEL